MDVPSPPRKHESMKGSSRESVLWATRVREFALAEPLLIRAGRDFQECAVSVAPEI